MAECVLVVPGYMGSGPDHWQTWLEGQLRNAMRVDDIEWDSPVLARWAEAVRDSIDRAHGPVWMVAHSFGCFAAAIAASERPARVAGALLVAPADPDRFSPIGLRHGHTAVTESVAQFLPASPLSCPSVLIASQDDPWMGFAKAAYLANRWGSRFVNAGNSGHINAESGFGPWPDGLNLLRALQRANEMLPLGSIDASGPRSDPGDGVLTRLRRRTRRDQTFIDEIEESAGHGPAG